jgi:predicted acylesterase/phospholipase RssA
MPTMRSPAAIRDDVPPMRLRSDLPFRRIALVLSGGGALGAYEVGVLRALETVGLRPSILSGVSVGAVNAVIWLALGFRTAALERVWSRLRSSSVGMRWITLMVRALGAFVIVLALVQVFLILAGTNVLRLGWLAFRPEAGRTEVTAALLDVAAWLLVAVVGQAIVRGSRGAEDWLARLTPPRDPQRLHRLFGITLLAGALVHIVTWAFGEPWPHRFSATILLLGTVIWFANRPGVAGERMRGLFLRLLPETGGRGLWGSDARRRLILQCVAEGDAGALVDPATHVIVSACEVDTGQMVHFINWPDPGEAFRARAYEGVGEVLPLARPDDVIEAAVASSAIPVVFEPVRIGGREFVDGGVFSSQPLQAVIADDADAMIVVLVTPCEALPKPHREPNLFELGSRLIEIASWRDLQSGLRRLPSSWTRHPTPAGGAGDATVEQPARVCVVEPGEPLPGGLYSFAPALAAEQRRRGEADAWRALAAAGWLADVPALASETAGGSSSIREVRKTPRRA